MKKKKGSAKPISDALKKENDYMKMLYKVSPLFVSASSWLIVSIDNRRDKNNLTTYKNELIQKKSKMHISTGDSSTTNLADPTLRNYYNRYTDMKQEFVDGDNSYFMLQKDCHSKREIASLTKIMTWYTVLVLCERYKIIKNSELITISKEATQVTGTTAKQNQRVELYDNLFTLTLTIYFKNYINQILKGRILWAILRENDVLSVWDLLHALMLPSGNDAAHALAHHFGELLMKHSASYAKKIIVKRKSNRWIFLSHTKNNVSDAYSPFKIPTFDSENEDGKLNCKQTKIIRFNNLFSWIDSIQNTTDLLEENKPSVYFSKENKQEFDHNDDSISPENSLSMFESSPEILRFIDEMNKNVQLLQMESSHFDSPHGLVNKNNKSTAYDMAKLWMQWVKMRDFNLITKWKTYLCNNKRDKAVLMSSLKTNKVAIYDYKWK